MTCDDLRVHLRKEGFEPKGIKMAQHRRTLIVDDETLEAFNRLQADLGFRSHSEVLQRAVQILETLVEYEKKGIKIIIQVPGKKTTRIFRVRVR